MSEEAVPSSVAQRIIIKFLTNEGVKPSEILTCLKEQFGDTTLSQNRVFTWARQFTGGRESIEGQVSQMTTSVPFERLSKVIAS